MNAPRTRAGLVLRTTLSGEAPASPLVPGSVVFVSAGEARAVVEIGARTVVDRALGVGVGVAALGGQLLTLLDLDPPGPDDVRPSSRVGVLAEIESGESVIVAAGPVVATGNFSSAKEGEGVVFEGNDVPLLSFALLYRKVEARIWEGRALASQARAPVSRRSEGRIP